MSVSSRNKLARTGIQQVLTQILQSVRRPKQKVKATEDDSITMNKSQKSKKSGQARILARTIADDFDNFGNMEESIRHVDAEDEDEDELSLDRRPGKYVTVERAPLTSPTVSSLVKKRKTGKSSKHVEAESEEEVVEKPRKAAKTRKGQRMEDKEEDVSPKEPINKPVAKKVTSEAPTPKPKNNGNEKPRQNGAESRSKPPAVHPESEGSEDISEKENIEENPNNATLDMLTNSIETLTTPTQMLSWNDLWSSEGESRLNGGMKTTDLKLELSAESWKKRYESLRDTLQADSSSNDIHTLKEQFADLEKRFDRLRKLRMTEPEELLDKLKKASSRRAAVLEAHVETLGRENDRLRAELESARKEVGKDRHPKTSNPSTQISLFSTSSQTDGIVSDDGNMNIDPISKEERQDLVEKCRKAQEDRNELAAAARMITEERDALKDKVQELEDALEGISKEKDNNQKAIQFWKDKAGSMNTELSTIRKQLSSTQSELSIQSANALKRVSEERYLLQMERMIRLYEEMTGITIQSTEQSTRPLDESDEEDADDEEDGEHAFDRRLSTISNRRKSMRNFREERDAPQSPPVEDCLVYRCEQKGYLGVLQYTISTPLSCTTGRCGYSLIQNRPNPGISQPDLPEFLAEDITFDNNILSTFFRRVCNWLSQRP
ncbi:hypothetical protein HDU67_008621 [Dinochytrium kinnereticum]|nr:hypothetical protein HDU67_008621 [Dinochytrium kinnereticum]